MTKKYTEEHALTYSNQKYSTGLPAKSNINDETISNEWSIAIPAAYMPDTSTIRFNVDTYRDDFKTIMITALDNAIKNNELDSNCGASVKSEYNSSSKQAMLESYAENVLNTVIYKIACEVMTENNTWVAQVITTYSQYCYNISLLDSGINAFLNNIYLTHAFEGEVKDDIVKFLDAMTAQAGFYGIFALTCAGQDSLQTTAAKSKLQENFVNTVTSINDRKTKAITGYDNYCYITGTVLEADTVSFTSQIHLRIVGGDTLKDCTADSWTISVPGIADSVYLPMIYNQYKKLPQGTTSFGEYLNKYGAQNDTDNKIYMTKCHGVQTFALNEGIYMKAERILWRNDYFNHGGWYHIDNGTDTNSKLDKSCYLVHDKITGDWFDSTNGDQSPNEVIAARACYSESYALWPMDEIWTFVPENVSMEIKNNKPWSANAIKRRVLRRTTAVYNRTVDILKSRACHDLNGDDFDDPENPFAAFQMASITPGFSDNIGPIYENVSTDITEVLLDRESFDYTGQPIEPAVTVFASEDVVPEDGYIVTYIHNIESGDSAVVRVEGTGDYSGVITKQFTITANASIENNSTGNDLEGFLGASSGGCNTMSGWGLALGLVFVIKKFRRR